MTYRPNRGGQGGWRRGRGRVGSYQGGPRPTTAQLPPDRDIMEGIDSRVIETISIPSASVQAQEFSGALMENVEYIASYNWTDSQEPTIIVPGSPPIWNDRRVPFTLSPDTGVQTVDQNGYRMRGLSSFLPLFAAADMTSATIDWPSIDIITDRNALRKLMRWINGTSARGTRDFRVDLELLGENTVVFNRWEKRFKEEPKYETFGFSFEEETTNAAPGCGASTGHHRIVKYDYFGLKMVVRFEVDACLPTPARISSSSRMPAISRKDDSDLSAALDKLSVQASSSKGAETTASHTYGLKIVSAGAKISQQSIIELTTRSQRRIQEFDWEEALPQLYLSSTPHLYIGVHQRGNFLEIRKFGLDEDKLVKERRAAAESYEKLGRVLEIIQGLVVEHGVDGALSLVCTSGRLEVYKRETGARLLPTDVRARFD